MKKYEYVLFDLDGTLTDSKEGITKSVQYALADLGIQEPDLDKLEVFIGPPLGQSFQEFYGLDEETAAKAVEKYRERFKTTGIFENKLYEGIPEMLKALQAEQKVLAVASSKPEIFVEQILEHFGIREYFQVVVGSELDGTRSEKEEVVEAALYELFGDGNLHYEKTVMVGDRKFDVEGGQAHGITTIGVAYGFGPRKELEAANADYIAESVAELSSLLLEEKKHQTESKPADTFPKIWSLMFPVLIGYFVLSAANYAGMAFVSFAAANGWGWFGTFDTEGQMLDITGNGMALLSGFAFLVTAYVLYRLGAEDVRKAKKERALPGDIKKALPMYFFAALAAIGMAIGCNLLLELLGMTDKISAWEQIDLHSAAAILPLTLLSYGLAAPIAEELLFRGIVYNRIRSHAKAGTAILLSSLLYAAYHRDLIAGSYALVSGILIAYVYEKTGRFYLALTVHSIANICAYLMTYTGFLGGRIFSWWMCIAFFLLMILGILSFQDYEWGEKKKAENANMKQNNKKNIKSE